MSERETTIDFWSKYSLLCILYQKAYHLPPGTKVPIAPPRESLIKYGGKLSYEDYHQVHKNNRKVEIYKLPLIPVMLHIQEIERSTNINNIIEKNQSKNAQIATTQVSTSKVKKLNQFIPIDPQKLLKAQKNLKEKNQERLQSNYTLDNCFTPPTGK